MSQLTLFERVASVTAQAPRCDSCGCIAHARRVRGVLVCGWCEERMRADCEDQRRVCGRLETVDLSLWVDRFCASGE
jgi:hypothetical protein